jgi:diguanylate cyclase (GGDEF)-like protein
MTFTSQAYSTAASAPLTDPFELSGSRVMMVDDDRTMLEVVQTYLEEAGYTNFITTTQSTQALALFAEHRPDVLLLDLTMPGIDGFDILAKIRSHGALRYTPVVVLTAETGPKAKLHALELGATDFLTKPVDPSELKLRLRNVLVFKAYQDRLIDFDALTGLLNRNTFRSRLSDALADPHNTCALLHLDLDRFKQINDTLGHQIGDRLLRLVARLLERNLVDVEAAAAPGVHDLRRRALLARISDNGFAILLPNLHSLSKVDDAAGLARRALDALSQPFTIDAHELFVTTSIGIAISDDDGRDADTLLAHAEMAMYQSKQHSRNGYEFFSSRMNAHAVERLTLELQLRRAVERNELVVHYQPKVDVVSQRITGGEALLRWKHPELGLVPPGKFIPVAEDAGLIAEIGQWVLREACRQAMAWTSAGLPPLSVSVNVSPAQFKQRKVWQAVQDALERSGLPPERLVLEVTEGMLMERGEDGIAMLHELNEMGLKLAIDDFGTGYSSFSYLGQFPMHELKIDRSFVQGISVKRGSAAIVGAIIAMARELEVKVVAEGVETREQLEFLQSRECDEYQGYLCSRPAPADLFGKLVRRNVATGRSRQTAQAMLPAVT